MLPARRLIPFLAAALLLLPACDRIKRKIDRIVKKTMPAPSQDAPLTDEEKAMNGILDDPKVFDADTAAAPAEVPAKEVNKSATVSILGYHDFKERGGTPMLIAGPKFRQQMQAIKDSKIPVIPMSELLAWKRGEKSIPEEAIVITMDDGWEGVYKVAYPILKEFQFPFTIYLYKQYVNIGGRSMTWEMIKEMMQHGCEIGSHTVTHDYLTNRKHLPPEEYQLKLVSELKNSKEFLEQNLGVKVPHVAYPYGGLDETVVNTTLQLGYEAGVTVSPQKVTWDTPNGRLPRYIVHGEEDTVFRNGTTFRTRGGDLANKVIAVDSKTESGEALVQLKPEPNTVITDRRPLIEANLIRLGSIVPESIKVRVAGFGIVPAEFDPKTFILRYQIPIKLRREECAVNVTFKRGLDKPEELINWKFKIDLAAAYLPTVKIESQTAPEPLPGESIRPAAPAGVTN